MLFFFFFFFFKQKTAYEIMPSLVGSEMCIRDRMAGTWCLDPDETLSEGQAREIDRVYEMYPHLNDDAFVAQNLETWKA